MNVLDVLIILAIIAVAITLAFGIRSLYQTGPEARSRSNKLMRLRVALQALAVALLVTGMWWKSTHGG
ncbi:NADH:ubiquinone oxidoreductase subunit 6 (subunit J) [Brevundimonas alba]|uniref:NADH:ubiquinone oxidoreductase subunit 6 (Subunit J) n=1 Tax=Brevundimonas alba TaxID=74314 RepID=A0A7X5YIL4_9CAUL|nr:twin transmembrane helix small protein [Brevundimonas alba]NJC40617.1 NADH:ubiquinone oxidoreductase subunit 6 (subunit J) [Brevundimonas alba]